MQATSSLRLSHLAKGEEEAERKLKGQQEKVLVQNDKYNQSLSRLYGEVEQILAVLATFGEEKDKDM